VAKAANTFSKEEFDAIHQAIARLRASIMSVVFGVVGGAALFLATIWLVVRGPAEGTVVGSNLRLLHFYFPGYDVTVLGSFIGLFYGALTGAAMGWVIAIVYNTIADRRQND
jgi:hypothetical protein